MASKYKDQSDLQSESSKTDFESERLNTLPDQLISSTHEQQQKRGLKSFKFPGENPITQQKIVPYEQITLTDRDSYQPSSDIHKINERKLFLPSHINLR